jgi:glycine betaine catabolism B
MLKTKVLNAQTHTFYEQVLLPKPGSPNECLIGRHASCDLVLDSPEISRVHCRVLFWQGQCYFADLGSTDGSRLNNEAVQVNRNYPLKPEDTIRMGNFVLLVESIDFTQQPAPLSPASAQAITLPLIPQWTQGEIAVRCVQIIDQTHDVKTFRFVAEPAVLFTHKPGQFVTLNLEIAGQPVKRSYSISSSPSRPHILEITVKRVPTPIDEPTAAPGLVSNWLHDHLTVGTQLSLKGPFGQFTCIDAPMEKLLFLSAGSGITPMMSMAQWLCDTATNADMVFVHSARSPRDIIFQQQLQVLAAHHPNFKLAITTTRPSSGQPWCGYTGHLNAAMLQTIAPDFQQRLVYVCGPNSFMAAAKTLLTDLDFPMDHYFAESFGPAKAAKPKLPLSAAPIAQPPVEPTPNAAQIERKSPGSPELKLVPSVATPPAAARSVSPSIVFTQSGQEVACDPEDCILEVAEQSNINLASGCRMGVCGACKLNLLEGEVTYAEPPSGLKETERQQGIILPCVAFPIGRVVLEA